MRILYRLRPADSLTLIFLVFLAAVSFVFGGKISRLPLLIFIYTILLLVQIFLIKAEKWTSKNRAADIVRSVVFPVVCVLVIFDSLELFVHSIHPKDIDPLLIKLDYLLFKGYPTVMLESIQVPLFTDILQCAYSAYYFLPISLGLLLKLKGDRRDFDKTVFLILLCFYLSYVGYMFFPALGPRYTMHHLQSSELRGLFIAGPVQKILNGLEGVKRDAFPSGHTAVALVVSGLSYRFHKGFFYMTLPVVSLLIFSTVYCRYHYVVDVIGGIVLAAITFFIGEKYYGYWEVRKSIDH